MMFWWNADALQKLADEMRVRNGIPPPINPYVGSAYGH